jgi:hypothetical protein
VLANRLAASGRSAGFELFYSFKREMMARAPERKM